jgi:hypothetical protein
MKGQTQSENIKDLFKALMANPKAKSNYLTLKKYE